MSPLVYYLAHVTILAYAFVGGVFLAFSDFIMRDLSRTSGHGGAEAMQVINRFMTLFLGLAAVSLLLVALAAFRIDSASAMLIAAAGVVYLLGCFAEGAAVEVEVVVGGRMNGGEFLQASHPAEALHRALSPSKPLV